MNRTSGELTLPADVLGLVVNALVQALSPDAVYLFGSAGEGRLRPDSDVDLAVLVSDPITPRQRWTVTAQAADLVGRDVDLVDLRRSSTVLQALVVSRGRRIWVNDASRVAWFEMRVLKSYALLNEERAPILERMQREGSPF